jgi:hypothetical protein
LLSLPINQDVQQNVQTKDFARAPQFQFILDARGVNRSLFQ